MNILSSQTYFALPIDTRPLLRPVHLKLFGANGLQLNMHGEIALDLEINGCPYKTKAVVADLTDCSGILGMSFFVENKCHMDLSNGVLQSADNHHPCLRYLPDEGYRLQILDTGTIADGETAELQTTTTEEVSSGEIGSLNWEPDAQLMSQLGLVPATTALQVSSSGKFTVKVWNFGGQEVNLLPGTTLGIIPKEAGQQPAIVSVVVSVVKGEEFPKHLLPAIETAQETLDPEELDKLKDLVLENSDIFAAPGKPLGTTDVIEHSIDTGDATPIRQPMRRVAFAQWEVLDKEIERMLHDKVIEPSKSPWSSPLVIVKKKTGEPRICVDFRKINNVTKKDSYALSNIQELLDCVAGAQWYATLDLAQGFWQVQVREEDRPKTAFSTRKGLFQFIKMPFGLCNAPATFSRLMEQVLQPVLYHEAFCYLDDVIVTACSPSQMRERLNSVFALLRKAGLLLKPRKCTLFVHSVCYLGHVLSAEGVSCDLEKIAAIQDWPTPATVTNVRGFLGLCSYYRRFISGFADIAKPMVELTEKGRLFQWDDRCQMAFSQLKEKLTTAPILANPSQDPHDQYILDTDSSDLAAGAVLSQIQDGKERIIAFGSKALSKSQRAYCSTYKELLAIVIFLQKFRPYLLDREFVVRTDNSSLRWLLSFRDVHGILARWLSQLADYHFTVIHRPGKQHTNADALSRVLITPRKRCNRQACVDCSHPVSGQEHDKEELPTGTLTGDHMESDPAAGTSDRADSPTSPATCKEGGFPDVSVKAIASMPWLDSWSQTELQQLQEDDPDIGVVKDWISQHRARPSKNELLEYSARVRALVGLWQQLRLEDNLLFRFKPWKVGTEHRALVVPLALQFRIFEQIHGGRLGGHLGISKTLAQVRQRFYWTGCKQDIQRWTRECQACEAVKPGRTFRAKLSQMPVREVFDRVAIDFLCELTLSERGNKHILVVCDYFTKWTEAYAMPDMLAQNVADVLTREFFCRFGMPRHLHSDQGRNFESKLFSEVCQLLGIRKTRTTPFHPSSDGLVERQNRTLLQMLRIVIEENVADWDEHLPYVMAAYRNSVQESTQETPFYLMFGRHMTIPLDLCLELPKRIEKHYKCQSEYVLWLRRTFQQAHSLAEKHLKVAAQRQKNNYDARSRPHKYSVGDFCWRAYPPLSRNKLGKRWKGPYYICGTPTSNNCELQLHPDGEVIRCHADNLKPWFSKVPKEWTDYLQQGPFSEASNDEDSSSGEPDSSDDAELEMNDPNDSGDELSGSEPEVEAEAQSSDDNSFAANSPPVSRPESPQDVSMGRGKRSRRPPERLDL